MASSSSTETVASAVLTACRRARTRALHHHATNKADKCTFCAHRVDASAARMRRDLRRGARIFGDLNDPDASCGGA